MQAIRIDLRRLYAIGFTALLHVALISGLLLALTSTLITLPKPRIIANLLPETAVDTQPPPSAAKPVLIEPGDVVLPMPNLPPIGDAAGAITVRVETPRGTVPVTAPAPAALLAPVVVLPRADPLRPFVAHFPATSRRLGESGSVLLEFIVGADGRVQADSIEVRSSSGFPRLDDAARSAIRKVRFLPGTQDGSATAMRHQYRITYALDG
jgi:protein TonB